MKNTALTREQVIALMKARQGERSLRSLARDLGCSAAYVSDVYLGRREPGIKILKAFGLRPVRTIVRSFEIVRSPSRKG